MNLRLEAELFKKRYRMATSAEQAFYMNQGVAAICASSGSNKFANLLSHGSPMKPLITEGTAKNTNGNVIDHGDS